MPKCVFCLEEKNPAELTDEHIIPEALGSQFKMKKASCKSCQGKCNKSFEHRFLKGSNFIALIRSHLGLRGKRNEPVFGFDQHGKPLTILVQSGFPPIRVGLAENNLVRPMQIILTDEHRNPLSYHFLPNELKRPLLPALFDDIIKNIPEKARIAALWADGDIISANGWRELLEAFEAWVNIKKILPITSSIQVGKVKVNFTLEWRTEYDKRGLNKIGFMYALSQMTNENIYSPALEPSRSYILHGTAYPIGFWSHGSLLQWSGSHPALNLFPEHQFTYFLATITLNGCLYSFIQLHNMGLFAVKLSTPTLEVLAPNSLITYLLNKNDNGNCSLVEHKFCAEIIDAFIKNIQTSEQLYK